MAYGATLTLPTITGTIVNMGALLKTADFPTAAKDGGSNSIANGGGNLRVYTNSSKATQLAIEVVRFVTGGAPDIEVWVNIPSAATGGTVYIERDAVATTQPAVGDTYGKYAVWPDCDFVSHDGGVTESSAAHTMADDTSGSATTSPWGAALTAPRKRCTDTSVGNLTNDFALSVWVNGYSNGTFACRRDNSTTQYQIYTESSVVRFNPSNTGFASGLSSGWHEYHLNIPSTATAAMYVDGVITSSGSVNVGTLPSASTVPFRIGYRGNGGIGTVAYGSSFAFGEVRVYNPAISADKIKAQYTNYTTANYWSVGAWADASGDDHTIAPNNLTFAYSLSSPTLVENYTIAPNNLTFAYSLSSPTLDEHASGDTYSIYPNGLTFAYSLSSPTLVEHYTIAPNNLTFAYSLSSPTLVEDVLVAPDDYSIAPNGLSFAYSLSSPTITEVNLDDDYNVAPNEWTSCVLGGIPILNPGNLVDPPQQWDLNKAHRLVALANWPANYYCKVMRSYKNILIALNITKPGGTFPYMVKWSHPADPGGVPVSWDETDQTLDAGEFDIAEGYDHIVDGFTLRDSFMIYKKASVWRLDYVGGAFIFRNQKVLGMSGALNRNCIVDVDGFHVVFTNNDIVIHDGVNAVSILDKVTRRWLFDNIRSDADHLCFAFKNPYFNEVFLCFPASDSEGEFPNKAIVYNYVDKLISIRSLPNIYAAATGPINTAGLIGTWEQDPDPWNSDLTVWNGSDLVPNQTRVMMGSADQNLFLLDGALTYNGVLPESFVERVGLSLGEPETIKTVRGIRPRISGQDGATVIIKVGHQDSPYSTPTYAATMTHTIGSTVANDCFVSGRYISLRFEAGTAYNWRLDSYEVDVVSTGKW